MQIRLPCCGLLALCIAAACTRGSGERATRSFEHRDFDAVECAGVFDVQITIAPEFSVVAIADDNILPLAEVSMRDGALVVFSKVGVAPEVNPRVEVTMPALRSLKVDCTAKVSGLTGGTLTATTTGHHELVLDGRLDALHLDADTHVDAVRLSATDADVEVHSGGHVYLGVVTNRLSATGKGQLSYAGAPKSLELAESVRVP